MSSSEESAATPDTLALNTVIDDRYKITDHLGGGGYGTVYKARDLNFRKAEVAVKLLHGRFAEDRNVVERFLQEAEIAASINSDYICEVRAKGTLDNGAPYIVMPYLIGQSLADLLEAHGGRLDLDRAVLLATQVLRGLSEAHEEKIVHRDLKPENIFVTKDNIAKILDFGIAKVRETLDASGLVDTSEPSLVKPRTEEGFTLGTPSYMSPEQVGAEKDIDTRSDIWAMGVILYQMLTGQTPFKGDSRTAIAVKIYMASFTLPREFNPDIPEPVEAVIRKALQKDRNDRFPDADTMRRELEKAVAERGSTAGDSLGQTAPITAADTAPMETPVTPAPAPRTTQIDNTADRKPIAYPLILGIVVLIAVAVAAGVMLTSSKPDAPAEPKAGTPTAESLPVAIPAAPDPASVPIAPVVVKPAPPTVPPSSPETVSNSARTTENETPRHPKRTASRPKVSGTERTAAEKKKPVSEKETPKPATVAPKPEPPAPAKTAGEVRGNTTAIPSTLDE